MGATATDSIKENNIHKNYHIIIDEAAGVLKPKLSQINVFTDGSKTKHGVRRSRVYSNERQTTSSYNRKYIIKQRSHSIPGRGSGH